MIYSKEQLAIVKNLKEDKNIVVNAVAGSGKTTTSMLIASSFPNKKILLLTFNKRLTDESNNRKKNLGIENIDIYTFHGFFSKFYKTVCNNDSAIKNIIEKYDFIPEFNYDIIIIDEAQDINLIVYECLIKTFCFNCENTNLCVFGDERQSIYQFIEASSNFLIKADQLFDLNNKNWVHLNLSQSFRLTIEMTDFLNKVYMKENYINSNKKISNSVDYFVSDKAFNVHEVYKNFLSVFKKYKPEDIFVISPSIKGSQGTPLALFENILVENKIPVYKPVSSDEDLKDIDIENKLVFTSIHQSKGRERKVAFIFNADDGYFKFYAKKANPNIFPNTMYVAMTRALEKLIIITNNESNPFSFTNLKYLKNYYSSKNIINYKEYINKIDSITNTKNEKISNFDFTVLSLTNFLSIRHIYDLLELVKWNETIYDNDYKINNTKWRIECNYNGVLINEPTNIYNGIFFPLYYRFSYKKNSIDFKEYVEWLISNANLYKDDNSSYFYFLYKNIEYLNNILQDIDSTESLLKLSVVLASQETRQISRIKQIDRYDWVSEEDKESASKLLNSLLDQNSKFEEEITYESSINKQRVKVRGLIDCIDDKNKIVWEFKFSRNIRVEQKLQLICYRAMLIKKDEKYKDYKFKLLNIKDGKVYEMDATNKAVDSLFDKIIELKIEQESISPEESDIKVLEKAMLILKKYISN